MARRKAKAKVESGGLLDAHDAARLLGMHVVTVRRLAREGKIPCIRYGGSWRFNPAALNGMTKLAVPSIDGARILVVDDEPTIHAMARRMLQPEGHTVIGAAGGEEALRFMRQERPDVVLLDLQMPGMDGPTVLAAIRRRHGAVPVVIITAHPDSDLMARALEHSPVLLVPKPFRKEQLTEAVQLALRGSFAV